MAGSTASERERRAQLIKGLARDVNDTRHSHASSASNHTDIDFTNRSFDPENEAFSSTKPLDESVQLPTIPATITNTTASDKQKYTPTGRPNLDYQFNTSAIRKAFPDFSGGSSSSEGEDQSRSIEVGRGIPACSTKPAGPFPPVGLGDSFEFSEALIDKFDFRSPEQPHLPAPTSRKENKTSVKRGTIRGQEASAKENVKPISTIKTTDFGSASSRQGSNENPRGLASLHARVRNEEDNTQLSDERPPSVELTSRSTRFAANQSAKALTTPASKSTRDVLVNLSRGRIQPSRPLHAHRNNTVSTFNQSLMLPDMPNVSELVSGCWGDGTPVFSRQYRHNSSRFPSRAGRKSRLGYITAAEVSLLPDDEQSIIVSLDQLKARVAELEDERGDAEARIQELQEKNAVLERERLEQKAVGRADSALGSSASDDGDDMGNGSRRTIIEKTRLEATVKTLREEMETWRRKARGNEFTVKALREERDSAVSQLGVAYISHEQVKADHDALLEENEQLKVEVARLKDLYESVSNKATNDGSGEEIMQLKSEVANLKREAFSKRTSTLETAEENEQLKDEVARLRRESSSKRTAGLATEEENEQLKTEVARLKRETFSRRTQTSQAVQENDQLKDEVARLTGLCESHSRRTPSNEVVAENNQLKTEVARLTRESSSKRTHANETLEENEQLRNEVERLTQLCESYSKRASSTQTIEENEQIKTEFARLLRESASRKTQSSRTMEENDQLKVEVARLNSLCESLSKRPRGNMVLENEQLKAEVARLKSICESFSRRTQSNETVKRTHTSSRFSTFPTISEQDFTQVLDVDLDPKARGIPPITQPEPIPSERASKPAQQAPKKRKTRLVLEEYSESETSEAGEGRRPSAQQRDNNTTRFTSFSTQHQIDDNETTGLLSNVSDGEIVALKRKLEAERRSQNARKARTPQGRFVVSNPVLGNNTEKPVEANSALPRRSSMKDLTGRLSEKGQQEEDVTTQSKKSVRARFDPEISLLEQRNRQRGVGMEDMTSAVIVPDITIRNPGDSTVRLSAANRDLFDKIAHHDGQNCTICKRVIEHGKPHSHKEKITIPRPIPVSERMPDGTEADVTMRPSQPPALALATVIKGLEDELAHLKVQLAQYQALYNQQDPSLSKRKRKSVYTRIEKLLATIDEKADQIYALYDVVEGQKAAGQQMTEQEVEVTLLRVGIDLTKTSLRGGELNPSQHPNGESDTEKDLTRGSQKSVGSQRSIGRKKQVVHSWDNLSDDDEDLPWEGFH